MIYLDTSAILKLLRRESQTAALAEHLDAYADHDLVTSALSTVEVARALTAVGEAELAARVVPRADRIEIGEGVIPAVAITAAVLDAARVLPPDVLRSLDAIHVATALLAGKNLDHLVTYDKRMIAAAEAAGLATRAPS